MNSAAGAVQNASQLGADTKVPKVADFQLLSGLALIGVGKYADFLRIPHCYAFYDLISNKILVNPF